MGRHGLVTRFAALGGFLSLIACAPGAGTGERDMTQGFTAAPAPAATGAAPTGSTPSGSTVGGAPAALDGTAPGYALAGAAFSGVIVFEDQHDRPVVVYRHTVDGAPDLIAELDPAPNWLSDGVRRFQGVSDRGVEVVIELVAGPCRAGGRTYGRFAQVRAGRLAYEGCARETGPSVRWSEALPRYAEPIDSCLAASRSGAMAAVAAAGPARVVHARAEDGAPVIRFQFGETGRWDCRAAGGEPRWSVVAEAAPALPGEGDPVYAPGRPPRAGQGCYLWEHVRASDGRIIGALGEDVCGAGAAAPATGF